jgi:hypothetical protein
MLRDAAGSVSVKLAALTGRVADGRARGSPGDSGPRLCVLCLRANQPMTREHIFARWLVRQVHGARLVASNPSPGETQPSTAPMRIARVTAGVCAECNAGWMSSLEVSFRRTLFARPRVGVLQAPDRITLSRWFTKTAMLLAQAHGGTLVSAAHPAQLLTGMPDDIEVFLARRRRPRQHLDFALHVRTERAGALTVRSVAILVDDLVGHVAARGTLASGHGTRLWPLRTHTLRWETLPVITPPIAGEDDDRQAKRRRL